MSTSPTTTTNNNSNNENSKRIQSSSSSSATTTTTTTTPIDLEPVFAKVSLFARRYFKFLVEHLPRIVDLGERHSAAVNLCELVLEQFPPLSTQYQLSSSLETKWLTSSTLQYRNDTLSSTVSPLIRLAVDKSNLITQLIDDRKQEFEEKFIRVLVVLIAGYKATNTEANRLAKYFESCRTVIRRKLESSFLNPSSSASSSSSSHQNNTNTQLVESQHILIWGLLCAFAISKTCLHRDTLLSIINLYQIHYTSNVKAVEMDSKSSLAILMRDIGYGCCYSSTVLRRVLEHTGITPSNANNIKETEIGRTLAMMISTHTGLEPSAPHKITSSILNGVDMNELKKMQTWDVQLFMDTVLNMKSNLNLVTVVRNLDQDDFRIKDKEGFDMLLNAYRTAGGKGSKAAMQQFPVEALWGRWKNVRGQFSIIAAALSYPPELFNFSETKTRKIITSDILTPSNRTVVSALMTSTWNSLDLIETLANLVESPEVADEVKQLFITAAEKVPELLCLGLTQLRPTLNKPCQDLLSNLLQIFLAGHTNAAFVMARTWALSQEALLQAVLIAYQKDQTCLSKILDVAQELKALAQFLDIKPYGFSIDLAALASRRDYLNLDKWLNDHIRSEGDLFIRGCLEFLLMKSRYQLAKAQNIETPAIVIVQPDVIASFFKVLQGHLGSMAPETANAMKDIYTVSVQAYPQVMTLAPLSEDIVAAAAASATTAPAPPSEQSFPADVEEEANSYYEKIYKGEMRIPLVIELLTKFKTSQVKREQDIYQCMLHNLFDEYKFFDRYPEKELSITSTLFGALIQHQIVSYMPLGIALRYVLDALRQPIGSKLFKFGIQALKQFQARLAEWPQYCSHLLSIQHLYTSHPDLIQFIKSCQQQAGNNGSNAAGAGTKGLEAAAERALTDASVQLSDVNKFGKDGNPAAPALAAAGADSAGTGTAAAPLPFAALKLDTLLDASLKDDKYEVPDEKTQDKILFILNNVSEVNLSAKVKDCRDLLRDPHHRWFSNYLVVKRASIEPNYHGLYIAFLDELRSNQLMKHILHETLQNCKVLLNSEKTVTSSSERTLLKNLGTWLGGITLAKNKPIKHKNLAFKELLLEGLNSGRLIVVIPFVCKVLEQVKHSPIFRPPNPWLMAIMKVLAELYHEADLKLNLKFEIEVLCNNIKLDIKDIEPSNYLRGRSKQASTESRVAKEFEKLSIGTSVAITGGASGLQSLASASLQSALSPVGGVGAGLGGALSSSTATSGPALGIPNLAAYITFNPQVPLFSTQPNLKRIVHIAIDRAIREIITPVVERSVTIASIASRELVVKDFALEPEENKMRSGAHFMVQCLAGSLAAVTCREPLRISINSHLRSLLLQNGFTEQALPEQAIFITVADNLDLACSVVEKAAAEKAIPEIDESLATAYLNRRKHREVAFNQRGAAQPFYDMAVYAASRYPSTLPETLRLKPGGLLPNQMRVYEDFLRISRQVPDQAGVGAADARVQLARQVPRQDGAAFNAAGVVTTPTSAGSMEDGVGAAPMTAQQALEKFTQFIAELDKQVQANANTVLNNLPVQHDIRTLLRQIPLIITQCFIRDDVALLFSQKVVQLLYKNDSVLSREVYVILLERLCELSKRVAKEVTSWLLYSDDERKFNVPVTVAIIQARLLSVPELDMRLARLIELGARHNVVDFTAQLIRKCVLEESPCATQNDFLQSIDILSRMVQRGQANELVAQVLEDLRKRSQILTVVKDIGKDGATDASSAASSTTIRDQLAMLFNEWVRRFHHPASTAKMHLAFINQLHQQGILKGEDVSSLFFRVCTEISVESYLKNKTPGAPPMLAYQAVDAYARLIVLLITHQPEGMSSGNTNVARVNLSTKILSIIVLVLVHSHERRREVFNQKPFYRLFSSLLNDLHTYENQLQPIYYQILTAFSNTFHTLQPYFLPGFTFAWLQLVSHRHFMSKLLTAESQKGWPFFQRLLVDLFRFLGPFLRQGPVTESVRLMYRGTMRMLLVLLHDFPEFLCDYHFNFIDCIPHSCVQLRNLILSAFPRNMRLPDPFTPNLKVDMLPEINQSPHILSDYITILGNLKGDVDAFFKSRSSSTASASTFLTELVGRLVWSEGQKDPVHGDTRYNVSLINALVLYVGVQAIAMNQSKSPQGASASMTIAQTPALDIYQQLVTDMDSEGRYHLFSAMANHLRYPNSHTHYFSCVLLHLFAEAQQEVIQEQVTRVLLERLIVNRPHPYGLLITFIELIRNPRYSFWDHTNFIRCAPEIERLFESVARSINQGYKAT